VHSIQIRDDTQHKKSVHRVSNFVEENKSFETDDPHGTQKVHGSYMNILNKR